MVDISASNDLISRTELLNDLSYCAPELWQDEQYIKAKIMKQPAVDAAPVRHGWWVKEPDRNYHYRWYCSKCEFIVGIISKFYRYCPNCGAKMEDESNGQA